MPSLEELIERADTLTVDELKALPREDRIKLALELQQKRQGIQMENQLLFYKPVSDEARRFHCSQVQQRIILGGNGSSKSETQLVDLIIEMTGIIPYSLQSIYPKEKLRAPLMARLIVESFTSTWEGSIKPKLVWNTWTGLKDGIRGHWGWIPKSLLKNGKWEDSWSAEFRTLTLTNGSKLQIFSHDQEVSKMASASVHRIAVDEGPSSAEWRENLMRLREGGSISLAMTPPDEESKSWASAWVYDELYTKGQLGPEKDPDIDSFTFKTRDNPFVDQEAITKAIKGMTETQQATRTEGAFTHLGGLVYPIYRDTPTMWCFTCNERTFLVNNTCGKCAGTDFTEYTNFVEPDPKYYRYPTVFLIDPHPRKPVMMIWVAVDPIDDAAQIHEMELDKEPEDIAKRVFEFEKEMDLTIAARIMDSKMGGQAASNAGKRHVSVKMAYDQVGLRCKMADNDFAVGKNRLKSLLKPDGRTRKPRYVVFNTCKRTNFMFKHFVWDEFVHGDGKDQKQQPKSLNDDFPALARYFANEDYTFARLTMGIQPMRSTKRQRRTAYG
jgi:hypothetical protein